MRAAIVAVAAACAVWLYYRRRNRAKLSWQRHVQDAINLAGPIEHVTRPLYEHMHLDGWVYVYCTDCDAMLDACCVTEGQLLLARAEHTKTVHTLVGAQ